MVFFFFRQFGHGAVQPGNKKNRIVAKPARSLRKFRTFDDLPFKSFLGDEKPVRADKQHHGADKSRASLGAVAQFTEKQGIALRRFEFFAVFRCTRSGVAGGKNPRAAAEGVDADAGVVGNNGIAGGKEGRAALIQQRVQFAGLEQGVFLKA